MINNSFMKLAIILISIFFITPQINIAVENTLKTTNQMISVVSLPESYYTMNNVESLTILYPRSTLPTIVESGKEIIIQFQSILFDSISINIQTAYDPLPDDIHLSIEKITQENIIYFAHAIIPNETPEELYNLTLTIHSEGKTLSQTRPRAVSVQKEIDDNFSFIQIADFHIGDPRGLKENPKETIGWRAARKTIEEINLLNPDFVIISGDLTFGQLFPFEYTTEYKKCYEIIQEFQVPTYLCPGNHDGYIQTGQDGFKFWETYFGPLYYSFDYANFHFLSINSYDWPKIARIGFSYLVFNWGGSIQPEQLNWIEQDLKEHENMNQCINLHHNPLWDTTSDSLLKNEYQGREELLHLINIYEVNAVFAGHVHYDDVTIKNNTLFITTTTAASGIDKEDGYWGYRLITVENNSIESYNYKEPKFSIPSYQINYTYHTEKSIEIENNLEQSISVLIEFIVPIDDYTLQNAIIHQVREKDDMAAYYVTSIINPKSRQTITLE